MVDVVSLSMTCRTRTIAGGKGELDTEREVGFSSVIRIGKRFATTADYVRITSALSLRFTARANGSDLTKITATKAGIAGVSSDEVSAIAAAHQTIKGGAWLPTFTLSAVGQNRQPDFTGVWRSMSITRGPLAKSITEIKQTDSTAALRSVIPNLPSMDWSIYSIDGKVLKTKMGRHLIESTGRCEGNQLILRETGPGNAPWRRSTERRILSLSGESP
jgi:hypothetical protein